MRKVFFIFCVLISLAFFTTRSQPAIATDCTSFLGTDPALPKDGENILLKFSPPNSQQTYTISVNDQPFTLSAGQRELSIGSLEVGNYELKIKPITSPESGVCAIRWFKVLDTNSPCTNNSVGTAQDCGSCPAVGSYTCCQYNQDYYETRQGLPWLCYGSPLISTPTQPPAPSPPCAEGKLDDGKCTAVDTGLGISIETKPAAFIKSVFGILLGLSGGIALLLIIASGYRLMASQGNPEKLQGAKEMLTSAIVGLLFIIFSFVILEVIGVDILKIPGFNR